MHLKMSNIRNCPLLNFRLYGLVRHGVKILDMSK